MATIGDIVLFMLDQGRAQGQTRPAIIVALHPTGEADLTIFLDGERDDGFVSAFPIDITDPTRYFATRTASQGSGAGQWHERKAEPQHAHPLEPPPAPRGKSSKRDDDT